MRLGKVGGSPRRSKGLRHALLLKSPVERDILRRNKQVERNHFFLYYFSFSSLRLYGNDFLLFFFFFFSLLKNVCKI